jgi:hypothetical protein
MSALAAGFAAGRLTGNRAPDSVGEALRVQDARLTAIAKSIERLTALQRAPSASMASAACDPTRSSRADTTQVPSPPTAPASESEPPPSEAAIRAFDNAQQVIETSKREGRWTMEHRMAVHAYLSDLNTDQRDSLMGEVVRAVNSGQIRKEEPGAPF